MNRRIFLFFLFSVLLLCSCGSGEPQDGAAGDTDASSQEAGVSAGEDTPSEDPSEDSPAEDQSGLAEEGARNPAADTAAVGAIQDSPLNHGYNSGIYIRDGYTYRLFPDGLYRRAASSADWEMLADIPSSFGAGLASYGSLLYFACHEEAIDTYGHGWNNALYYYDTATQEYGQLFTLPPLVGQLAVYGQTLYIESYTDSLVPVYTACPLNGDGQPGQAPDEKAAASLCEGQNRYFQTYYQALNSSGTGMSSEELQDSLQSLREQKAEVLFTPACASLLDGKVVLQQYKNEAESSFFLRDLAAGEDTPLFDGAEVIAVTREGIYYTTAPANPLSFYSFADGSSRLLEHSALFETDALSPASSFLTWDDEWLYFCLNSSASGGEADSADSQGWQLIRLSRSGSRVEIAAEGSGSDERPDKQNCQTDGEYLYYGSQMIPLPDIQI